MRSPHLQETTLSGLAKTFTKPRFLPRHRAGSRRRWSRIGIILPLWCALVVAGCSTLPESSAPRPFDVSVPDSDPIELSADGPTDGADPLALLQDFLLACAAGPNDDFATARLFLTSDSAQKWNPESEVLIYDTSSSLRLSQVSNPESDPLRQQIRLEVPALASVDADGVMTLATQTDIDRTFTLVKEAGQWRIQAPENSFLVSRSSFIASYELANLWFPSTSLDALVPDPRWYPARRLAGHLLSGLVAGPQASLNQSVSNAIPGGTTIPSQGVEVKDRIANVRLNAAVPNDQKTLQLIAWSVHETLIQAPSITGIRLTLSGETIETDDLPSGPRYLLDTGIALTQSGLGIVSGSSVAPLKAQVSPESGASLPAMSPVSSSLIAWKEDSTLVVARGHEDTWSSARAPISSQTQGLSIDRFGWTWALGSSSPEAGQSSIVCVNENGVVSDVNVDGDVNGKIRAIRVSPDGARALVIVDSDGVQSLWMAGVVRNENGTPRGLHQPNILFANSWNLIDASWSGSTGVVAGFNSTHDTGQSQSLLVDWNLGGFYQMLTLPAGTTSVSAGTSSASTIIRMSDGRMQYRAGALWQQLAQTVKDARYSG
ncbi:GerMN domain-containing protein [Schaalia sp. ZJ405]|uniref:LpqB family beta-propeller domain-containing protein n=1 Tax=Schaalia sp. ZJ405 TaxID=2709403 RepID=UPI0013ECE8E1|nr:LpqB family beta-propeller domain-containing protein [Schaalia sp. ZJ405]QPK81735.1 GerMN domain-containing protein [Schaalia sp. ZJ405]